MYIHVYIVQYIWKNRLLYFFWAALLLNVMLIFHLVCCIQFICSYDCMVFHCILYFIQFPVDGHLNIWAVFSFGLLPNSDSIIILVNVFWLIYVSIFVEYIPRSETVGSDCVHMFSFPKHCQKSFQSDHTSYTHIII